MSILIKGVDMPPVDSDVIVRIWGTGYIQRIESYHSYEVPDGKAIELPLEGVGTIEELQQSVSHYKTRCEALETVVRHLQQMIKEMYDERND